MTTSVLKTAINRSKVSWGTATMNTFWWARKLENPEKILEVGWPCTETRLTCTDDKGGGVIVDQPDNPRDFSRMVTHSIFNLITQGLNSVNRLQLASPFGASRATLDLLPLLLIVTYQRLLRDSRSGPMRNMLKDNIKWKYCYLAETTLLRSFKFALTESVSTYSGETKGSLLPLAIQNPSKLQNSPPPRGISRGWFKMLEGFTCPSKNRWIRDWTAGWDDRSNCVRKLKQNPWQKMQTMQVRLRFFLGKTTFTSLMK